MVHGCSGESGSGHVDNMFLDFRGDESVQTKPTGLEVFTKSRILTHRGCWKGGSGFFKRVSGPV